MSLGGGGSNDWLGRMLRAEGSREVEREGKPEYDAPSYSVSFRSVLIVVLVTVALIVGAIVIFT